MLVGLLAAITVFAAAVVAVVVALDRQPAAPVVEACTATMDGVAYSLDPDQAQHAALFAGLAEQRGLPARAVTIAIATAMQESKIENIDYGDRDSLGLFQQRPSQGWGTPEQVTDPVYATGTFYDHLVKVDGYQDLPITEAAQAVQRSGFPEAYARHESVARAWASALTGHSPGAITCTLRDPQSATTAATATTLAVANARLTRDLGTLAAGAVVTPATGATPATITLPASGAGSEQTRRAAARAAWAVATAHELGTTSVTVGDQTWTRAGDWAPAATPAPAGTVVLTFR